MVERIRGCEPRTLEGHSSVILSFHQIRIIRLPTVIPEVVTEIMGLYISLTLVIDIGVVSDRDHNHRHN